MTASIRYNIRPVHKISSSPKDSSQFLSAVELETLADDRRALGKALRTAGILNKGERLNECRILGGRIAAFPQDSVWHAYIIERADVETYDIYVRNKDGRREHIGFGHGATDAVQIATHWAAGPTMMGWVGPRHSVEIESRVDGVVASFAAVLAKKED